MNNLLRQLGEVLFMSPVLGSKIGAKPYDPELLYVECRLCGNPVMWEAGKTTLLLRQSDINPGLIDESCMILSEGCHHCHPENEAFSLSIVRLASITAQEIAMLHRPAGNA
jgi:hypothetical protein